MKSFRHLVSQTLASSCVAMVLLTFSANAGAQTPANQNVNQVTLSEEEAELLFENCEEAYQHVMSSYLNDVNSNSDLIKQLELKNRTLSGVAQKYAELAKLDSRWGIDATVKLGLMNQQFADELLKAPVPQNISEVEELDYVERLFEFSVKFEEKAVGYYEAAVKKSVLIGVKTDLLFEAEKQLFELRPLQYPNPDPNHSESPAERKALIDAANNAQKLADALDTSKQDIQMVVRSHYDELRGCYQSGIKDAPDLSGTITVLWSIRPDGSVDSARIKESTLNNTGVNECVLQSISKWQFTQSSQKLRQVEYPFSFVTGA